jgi:pimeloyl-ACP methyl ester carboxylesterase
VLALPCAAGLISFALARDRPELVSKLVLIQTPSWPEEIAWSRRVDSSNLLGKPIVGQLLMAFGKRRVATGWYKAVTPDRETAGRFDAVAQERLDHGAGYCLASIFQAIRREPTPDFGVLGQDALVLWGLADRTHRRTDKRSPWPPPRRTSSN